MDMNIVAFYYSGIGKTDMMTIFYDIAVFLDFCKRNFVTLRNIAECCEIKLFSVNAQFITFADIFKRYTDIITAYKT